MISVTHPKELQTIIISKINLVSGLWSICSYLISSRGHAGIDTESQTVQKKKAT